MKQLIKRIFNQDASDNPSSDATHQAPTPEKTPYEIIGGEAGTRALAYRFYDIMESAWKWDQFADKYHNQ